MHSASGFDRIEVVTGVERRRRWSLGGNALIRHERLVRGAKVWYFSSLLFRWRKLMAEGDREAIRSDDAVVSVAEVRELKGDLPS